MPHKPGRSASPLAGLAPEDILTRMTLDEKIGQLHMVSADAVVTGPSGPPGGLRDLDQGRVAASPQTLSTEPVRPGWR